MQSTIILINMQEVGTVHPAPTRAAMGARWIAGNLWLIRHSEERSDVEINKRLILRY